ncbi:hypothetical protein N0V86_008780 [Didymella sp. IMI 355093]|nr:hypothetical protein N0V86_008780 [Didymella sp. IMI 355093]
MSDNPTSLRPVERAESGEGVDREAKEEGGEKGQKMFEDIERNAASGRALTRGERQRRASRKFLGFEDATKINSSSDEDMSKRDEKPGTKGKAKAAEKPSASGSNGNKGKGKEKEKAPVKWPRKQDNFDRPPSRPRDFAKTKQVETPSREKNAGGRRILAQRDVGERTWYLLDWFPTWVPQNAVADRLTDEWRSNQTPHTFSWGTDLVYKLKIPNSDDADPLVRTLLESVFQMYVEYMAAENHANGVNDLAEELFEDDDWELLDTEDNSGKLADALSNDKPPATQLSAAKILRRTFRDAWNHHPRGEPESDEAEYLYGDVRVTYNGWLDDKSNDNQFQPENGVTVRSLIEPMFHPMLWDEQHMHVPNWDAEREDGSTRTADEVSEHIRQIALTLSRVVSNCLFLLKKPWPLMLVALFWWDEELKNLINVGVFRFTLLNADEDYEIGDRDDRNDSWECRTADMMIYTYLDECDREWRAIDEIWTTFVEAQKLITQNVKAANSSPDDDDFETPNATNENEKGKVKALRKAFSKALSKRKGGGNKNAPSKKPRSDPPPMSDSNGEGSSVTNAGRKRARTEPNDDDWPTKSPPRKKSATSQPKKTAAQRPKPAAPTATNSGSNTALQKQPPRTQANPHPGQDGSGISRGERNEANRNQGPARPARRTTAHALDSNGNEVTRMALKPKLKPKKK